jgi:hypothetical protein
VTDVPKLGIAKDPRIRTVRVTQFYRGVVLAPDTGEEYLLLTVHPHDDAIAYAIIRRFTVNHALGVLEVRDQSGIDGVEPALRRESGSAKPLFAKVKDGDLKRLGVDSIGVAARSGQGARLVRDALTAAAVPASTPAATKTDAVRVGTMHAMKGLEFRCVAAVGVEAETVPAPAALTPTEEDPVGHELDVTRERCLLFVACTRARDGLDVSYVGTPSPFLGQG